MWLTAHVLSKLHLSPSDTNTNKHATPEAWLVMQQLTHLMSAVWANKKTAMGPLQFGLCGAHLWTSLPKWTASDEQMCKFFPTEECWQRAWWQGWNEHSVCHFPGVHSAAHPADPGLNIYSPSVVCPCMFVCICGTGKASEDLRALQGCEARSSKRQKIPAAFGLVSASKKPGYMCMCTLLKSVPAGSFYFSVQVWNRTPLI